MDYSQYITLAKISEKINFYTLILAISIGIPGNIISILIFVKPCLNNKTNTGLLYTLLCLLNLISILFKVLVKNPNMIFNYNIQLYLKTEQFIEIILLQFVAWSQVLITFDRFIAVMSPIKGVRIMSKRWVLYSIILGTFVIIIGLNSLFFVRELLYRINVDVNNDEDKRKSNISKQLYIYIEIIKVSMQLFIPYSIMVILDSIAIFRLRKVNANSSERQSTQTNSKNKSSRFTRNTILIDLIYLIFNFPSTIFDIYYIYFITSNQFQMLSLYFVLIFGIFLILSYVYSSILFLIFIIFNRIFRAEFISIINQQRFFNFIKQIFA